MPSSSQSQKQRVLAAVKRHSAPVSVSALVAELKGNAGTIKNALHRLGNEGELVCSGVGRAAKWSATKVGDPPPDFVRYLHAMRAAA